MRLKWSHAGHVVMVFADLPIACGAAALPRLLDWWAACLQHQRSAGTNAGLKAYKPTTPGRTSCPGKSLSC